MSLFDVIHDAWIEIVASDEDVRKRADICDVCEHQTKHTHFCNECNCFLPVKIRAAPTHCPLNKWGKVNGHKTDNPNKGGLV